MSRELRQVIPAGFAFGLLFSFVAFYGGLPVPHAMLWVIPFAAALLCGLGVVIGKVVTAALSGQDIDTRLKYVFSFLAAAVVNTAIVLVALNLAGFAVFNREAVIGIVLGLGAGSVYGIYVFVMDKMKERLAFLEALADNNRRLQEASRKLAIAEERNRLGRELHDSVSQGLHALVFTIHSLRNELAEPSERVQAILSHMEATANSTLDELRSMIEELRPSLLAEHGLAEALRITGELFSQRNQIPLELTLQTTASLSPELEMTIYRLAQEALANVERHASARHVALKLLLTGGRLILTIRDDGVGFDSQTDSGGNGLRNMRQRTEDAGGVYGVVSRPGLGTTITAEFPQKG